MTAVATRNGRVVVTRRVAVALQGLLRIDAPYIAGARYSIRLR